jgi:hypothetical protein
MRFSVTLFTVFLGLVMPIYGQSVTVVMQTSLSQIDRGGQTRHMLEIKNTGRLPVVLEALNDHVFRAPDFTRLCRMKMPGARWPIWINVLLPGQTKTIHTESKRLKPGTHTIQAQLRYGSAESAPLQKWFKKLVIGPTTDSSEISVCQRLGPIPANAHVASPSDLPHGLTKRTHRQEWTMVIKPHPKLKGLLKTDRITEFLDDIPYFGFMVWQGSQAYWLRGDEMSLIGRLNRRAAQKLGSALATAKPFVINSDSRDILASTGLSVSKRERTYAARARLDPFGHVKTWFTVEVPALGRQLVRQMLSTKGAILHYDQEHGLILTTEGPTTP